MNRLPGRFFKLIHPGSIFVYSDPFQDGLSYWRERILLTILAAGTGLSFLALVPSVYMIWRDKRWVLLIADLTAFILAGLLLTFRRIDLKLRAIAALSISFLVGVFIILSVGFASGGPAWLFFAAVLAGILLGLRYALAATLLNAIALTLLGWLTFKGFLPNQGLAISGTRAIVAATNFIVLNAACAISVAGLLSRLQALNTHLLRVRSDLESEKEKLSKAKEELKQENAIRRNSEKALLQSERKYRQLTENIRDVIWTADMNFKFTYVSPATVRLQGWAPQEYLHLELTDILTPDSLQRVSEEFAKQFVVGEQTGSFELSSTLQLELRHKNGSTFWAEVTASFMLGEDNRPIGLLGVTRDITERVNALEEKERLMKSLERAKKMEALGMLAGGVAHDLNNVLSGIVSYPDLLLLDLARVSPLYKPIETIRESGKKAAAIVQDLLTLARRGVTASEALNLNDLITDNLKSPEFLRLLSFHPLVKVQTELSPSLSNVLGSAIHLTKTIMNLVSNAAEAMPQGGPIHIATQNTYLERPIRGYSEVREGSYVLLRVSDAGVGMSSEDQQRIFEPFYTKKKMGRSGTGLGMAVVWGTVQDHKGYIDVVSAEGQGTRIDLYLPATLQPETRKEKPAQLEALKGAGQKIMIVDDVKEQREIATQIAEQLGYNAMCAASGEAALDYLKNHPVDLVILDMIMEPGIDGLETYRRILTLFPRQRAIITSGYAETERVKSALELGVGGYVRKPYSVEDLGKAIKAELQKPSEKG
jgi:PAS domain S-box-containing protein